jgi:two-component system, NtrC family, sensor histidine kinase KinB
MKTSIRNKRFTMGMILFMVIILLLCVSSAFYLNRLSEKISTILTENHYSVIYAQEMSDGITAINLEMVNSSLTKKSPDNSFIDNKMAIFNKSLISEKNNITEVGEARLVSDIEKGYNEYRTDVERLIRSSKPNPDLIDIQKEYSDLYGQLILLAQINEKAIEEKTNDAKASAKTALIQMSFIGAFCFLIAYGFTFSFSSYFNERFIKLYDGIKDISSSKYNQRLFFTGEDEIYEISLIFNEMAETLCKNNQKMTVALQSNQDKDMNTGNIEDLKKLLNQIKNIEEQTVQLIQKTENK